MLLKKIQNIMSFFGLDIKRSVPWKNVAVRRQKLFSRLGIDHVIDVGANRGQYALDIRRNGYKGKITSLEPIPEMFELVKKRSECDVDWEVKNLAIGDSAGKAELYVTENMVSSSLLMPSESRVAINVNSNVSRTTVVEVNTLDMLHDLKLIHCENSYGLKIDAQGFEDRVLNGGEKVISMAKMIEIELSFYPLYKDQRSGMELLNYLYNKGWVPISFSSECIDPDTYFVLQNDVIFVRKIDLLGQQ